MTHSFPTPSKLRSLEVELILCMFDSGSPASQYIAVLQVSEAMSVCQLVG